MFIYLFQETAGHFGQGGSSLQIQVPAPTQGVRLRPAAIRVKMWVGFILIVGTGGRKE